MHDGAIKSYCMVCTGDNPLPKAQVINTDAQTIPCHKLWTEICEINQIFKGDLIKFCEIFTKITGTPKKTKKLLF